MVRCAGASTARAREAARDLIGEGCTGLLSFGMAGGLAAAVRPGTVVVAEAVIAPDGRRIATAADWRGRLYDMLGGRVPVAGAAIAASETVVATPAAKRALFEATSAAAVDMESLGVAEAAQAAEVPFLALRVIADPARRAVPGWIIGAIGADGRPRPGAVAAGFFRKPADIPTLFALARDSARALRVLRRVALIAGPGFGLLR